MTLSFMLLNSGNTQMGHYWQWTVGFTLYKWLITLNNSHSCEYLLCGDGFEYTFDRLFFAQFQSLSTKFLNMSISRTKLLIAGPAMSIIMYISSNESLHSSSVSKCRRKQHANKKIIWLMISTILSLIDSNGRATTKWMRTISWMVQKTIVLTIVGNELNTTISSTNESLEIMKMMMNSLRKIFVLSPEVNSLEHQFFIEVDGVCSRCISFCIGSIFVLCSELFVSW